MLGRLYTLQELCLGLLQVACRSEMIDGAAKRGALRQAEP